MKVIGANMRRAQVQVYRRMSASSAPTSSFSSSPLPLRAHTSSLSFPPLPSLLPPLFATHTSNRFCAACWLPPGSRFACPGQSRRACIRSPITHVAYAYVKYTRVRTLKRRSRPAPSSHSRLGRSSGFAPKSLRMASAALPWRSAGGALGSALQ
jgi:hypothetical protein